MLVAFAAALAVAAHPPCVTEVVDKVITHHCALCYDTPSAKQLSGDGVEWYVGGGKTDVGLGSCDAVPAGAVLKVWTVGANARIQAGDPAYAVHGTLRLVGGATVVDGISTKRAVEVVGPDATDIAIRNVVVTDDKVAVRAYRGDPTGPLLNVSGLTVSKVQAHAYALAMAHTTNDAVVVECDVTDKVLVQPVVALTRLSAAGCDLTDLGDMLAIYGRAYEVSFYNFGYQGDNNVLADLTRWLAIADVVLLLIIGTCHGSSASALRVKQD